jgi:hypothetical protein
MMIKSSTMKKLFFPLVVFLTLISCNGSNSETDPNQQETDSTKEVATEQKMQTVEFESQDSLLITANLYETDPSYPLMILCHQAKFCKYEYAGVAERFNEMGFNCLAVDLRSGGPIAANRNETWLRAVELKKPTDYLSAEQDIVAAINYGYEKYKRPVILLGSSYSSTLCIYQALENEKVSSVIAFSPGNYFAPERGDLIEKMIPFEKPFFLTAANQEMPFVRELVLGRQRNDQQIVFSPEGEGMHGARVLWPTQEGGEEYWIALEKFLEKLKSAPPVEEPVQ